ncbi:hypothetical protein WOLCODRAFT_146593 [Wolfiporia cocos MD-104 SS10]|uniref:Uncharacterized protein n=1 Tax=Wolfiporia cocos (strain MD-104) TaxID=742152 RepID=A0A2H3J501_WOLCO|nr:hypothetical protein WOLCODRAFT_146593 [Wolfiporia cocos MD-104 SS10]
MDSTKEVGSKAIGVGQAATAATGETASRAGTRLQDTFYMVCDRAQDDADYHKAIDTLFDLAHKWVHRSLDSTGDVNCATSLDAFVNDPMPEKHLITGIRGLRAFDSFLTHLCKCVDERGYVRSKEAKEKGDSLRKEWKELLDADSEKGQKWKADVGKLKEEGREFRRAIDRDEDLRRVRRTHAKLGDDLEDSMLAEAYCRRPLSLRQAATPPCVPLKWHLLPSPVGDRPSNGTHIRPSSLAVSAMPGSEVSAKTIMVPMSAPTAHHLARELPLPVTRTPPRRLRVPLVAGTVHHLRYIS